MLNLKKYKDQHDDIFKLIRKISETLDENKIALDATEIKNVFDGLVSKLKVHFAMEEDNLYLKLEKSENPEIIEAFDKFTFEMNEVYVVFNNFIDDWIDVENVQNNSKQYVSEMQNLFAKLFNHLEKEETILYPLAEKHG